MSAKSKSDRLRRIVMTVAGVSASGIAVGFFNYSAFGMDPFQVLAHGLWNLTPLSYGTFYTIFSLILFIFVFMAEKRLALELLSICSCWDISQNFSPGFWPGFSLMAAYSSG